MAAPATVVVGVAGWLTVSSLYAPFAHQDGFVSPKSSSIRVLDHGFAGIRYVLTGPRGQRGSIAYSVRNDGRYAVRFEGLADPAAGITAVGWAPGASPRDQIAGGHAEEVRALPVTIRPGEIISVWVTVTKPACQRGTFVTVESAPLRWWALGRRHVYDLRLGGFGGSGGFGGGAGIAVCYPARL